MKGNVLRKVYAVVSVKTFEQFKQRCAAEEVKLDEVLSAMVTLYANGGNIVSSSHTKKKIREEVNVVFDYRNAVKNDSKEKPEVENREPTNRKGGYDNPLSHLPPEKG